MAHHIFQLESELQNIPEAAPKASPNFSVSEKLTRYGSSALSGVELAKTAQSTGVALALLAVGAVISLRPEAVLATQIDPKVDRVAKVKITRSANHHASVAWALLSGNPPNRRCRQPWLCLVRGFSQDYSK